MNFSIATYNVKNQTDIFNVFNFASSNSSVEWSVLKTEIWPGSIEYQLGTFHLGDHNHNSFGAWYPFAPASSVHGGRTTDVIHSHPEDRTEKGIRESLGGDSGVSKLFFKRSQFSRNYLIYFPNADNGVNKTQQFVPTNNRTQSRLSKGFSGLKRF